MIVEKRKMSVVEKEVNIWKVKNINNILVQDIKNRLNGRRVVVTDFLAKMLSTRNIDKDNIINFLKPRFNNWYDPFLLSDMSKCVDRIIQVVRNEEKIVVIGDCNADGILSTVIVYDFLRSMRGRVEYYVVNRYVTTRVKEVELINSKGIKIIITDHHECKDRFPDAYGISNPKRKDSKYPFRDFGGSKS